MFDVRIFKNGDKGVGLIY